MKLTQWAIMSKNRKWIACGQTRNRQLESIEDLESGKVKKRILLYGTEAKAKSGYNGCGFYNEFNMLSSSIPGYDTMTWEQQHEFAARDYLEAVQMSLNSN